MDTSTYHCHEYVYFILKIRLKYTKSVSITQPLLLHLVCYLVQFTVTLIIEN